MGRIHGRITKDDIQAAGLRRWDGRRRVTTDWLNLYYEPELCFPNGDCLVYLREPGQSSRGPSFRIHTSQLIVKGFRSLAAKAVSRPVLPPATNSDIPESKGFDPSALKELFLPAPPNSDLDAKIDHHLDTRNFFAWLYQLPLAGRALGRSALGLKGRMDEYRPGRAKNQLDVVTFLDLQGYLDFRECVDHALGALVFAETFEIKHLWIDAFTHCVGLSHKGMHASLEYLAISNTTKAMITRSRMEMDIRLNRISRSVNNFFETDLNSSLLGLPQAAREHFDRFRSFVHSFYIEQHGFWPPQGFENDAVRQQLYASMYSDFRSLYHHLADMQSSTEMDSNSSATGGICTLQNLQAFDRKHHYESLPHPLPLSPKIPGLDSQSATSLRRSSLNSTLSRRSSLNPLRKRQTNKELRMELEAQALIDASNRDWGIMDCLLVRRYSDFEQQSVLDDVDKVSLVDGRKVRWILIYAVLQTLISVMQAPTEVRNTEGLGYSLCCHPPQELPWEKVSKELLSKSTSVSSRSPIEPDTNPLTLSWSSTSLKSMNDKQSTLPRRRSISRTEGEPLSRSTSRHSSLRRILTKKSSNTSEQTVTTKRPGFCEIFVEGYGNGLNEVKLDDPSAVGNDNLRLGDKTAKEPEKDTDVSSSPSESSTGVSREPSNASDHSNCSSGSADGSSSNDSGIGMSDRDHRSKIDGPSHSAKGKVQPLNGHDSMDLIHFNTATWDRVLSV